MEEVRNIVRAANVIVVGLLFESVCLVVGMVVVLVEFGWWWQGWLGITGDGGIILFLIKNIFGGRSKVCCTLI